MPLRDEINRKINKLDELAKFIAKQKNSQEWLDVILDEAYSGESVSQLLNRHKFKADANLIYRFRKNHARG